RRAGVLPVGRRAPLTERQVAARLVPDELPRAAVAVVVPAVVLAEREGLLHPAPLVRRPLRPRADVGHQRLDRAVAWATAAVDGVGVEDEQVVVDPQPLRLPPAVVVQRVTLDLRAAAPSAVVLADQQRALRRGVGAAEPVGVL